MSDDVEIVNLFGRLALDTSIQALGETLNVLKNLSQAIDSKTTIVNTNNIQGEVEVTNFPTDLSTETTLAAFKNIGSDIKTLVDSVKGLIQSNYLIISSINDKIVKQDTDHVVVTSTAGLTNSQLRGAPIEVTMEAFPAAEGGATEVTLGSLLAKSDAILTKLNNSVIKANTDEVSITAGDLRILSAMRALLKLNFDTLGNLRVSNTPIGTQAVSVTGTPTVNISSPVNLGNLSNIGLSIVLGKISFNKVLDRIQFS